MNTHYAISLFSGAGGLDLGMPTVTDYMMT